MWKHDWQPEGTYKSLPPSHHMENRHSTGRASLQSLCRVPGMNVYLARKMLPLSLLAVLLLLCIAGANNRGAIGCSNLS